MPTVESDTSTKRARWPQSISKTDDLYSVTNLDTGKVEYLIFSSSQKNATYARDNGSWWQINEKVIEDFDDPMYSIEFVDVDFIDEYDALEKGSSLPTVTAAAETEDACPPATLDIALNLRNRGRAISIAAYGPLNPNEPNEQFWQKKAGTWSVSIDEAKKSLCGNCVFFIKTAKIENCIAQGLESGQSGEQSAWDAIDAAELGFCEAFDFKCAASRTCDAWAVGGPITDDVQSGRGN